MVTGAGRGIGAAVARSLAESGAAVALSARTTHEVEQVAAALVAEGHRAVAVTCDVADPESVKGLAAKVWEALGPADILVNNAGMAFSAPLSKLRYEDWQQVMAVNATGTMLCTQAFLPDMVARRWGRVVNIASTAARMGAKYISAYAASKHAVLGLTRCVAAEVATSGVTVNAICPGYVDTEMTRETLERIMQKTGMSQEAAMKSILDTTPQRRLLTVEEVAHTVKMLCADEARGINGQALVIDGGELLS